MIIHFEVYCRLYFSKLLSNSLHILQITHLMVSCVCVCVVLQQVSLWREYIIQPLWAGGAPDIMSLECHF